MKSTILKILASTFAGGIAAYFNALLVPVVLLATVMVMDYISGIVSAWKDGCLNSRIGVIGIIKKVCYLLAIGVAIVVDLIIQMVLTKININITMPYIFGIIVTVWFVINELISILENVSKIGVPLPAFLIKVIKRLKDTVEKTADTEEKEN
ncbi:MAG: phage holin family protein [Ruminococcaceae bacterium]|nr:phage holin family protein [Oscillospiraceae bacterium]